MPNLVYEANSYRIFASQISSKATHACTNFSFPLRNIFLLFSLRQLSQEASNHLTDYLSFLLDRNEICRVVDLASSFVGIFVRNGASNSMELQSLVN